jgi:hypothetical protein
MKSPSEKAIDLASLGTVILTAVLFTVALFEKGLTHDMLLEAGVFLISVKLVLGAQKSEKAIRAIRAQLDSIEEKLTNTSSKSR